MSGDLSNGRSNMAKLTALANVVWIVLCSHALADGAAPSIVPPANNPFLAVNEGPGLKESDLVGEDASSPYSKSHLIEERAFYGTYLDRYDNETHTLKRNDAGVADADGRPLWFDSSYETDLPAQAIWYYLGKDSFDILDQLYADWNGRKLQRADGAPWLTGMPFALKWLEKDADWQGVEQKLRRWRIHSPKSPLAALAEAQYWIDYAWDARGGNYASQVTTESWQIFGQRLDQAVHVLEDSRSYASGNPHWYTEYMEAVAPTGWPNEKLMSLFQDSVKADPKFVQHYEFLMTYLEPKWGGSWAEIDKFVRDSAIAIGEPESPAMYARLYIGLDGCWCTDILHETRLNWAEMRTSFEALVKLYPHSAWLANKYASFACRANDKDTYLRRRYLLGKAVTTSLWRTGYSVDLCDHKFGIQTP